MAKAKDESKSEVFPGGIKAGDIKTGGPASVPPQNEAASVATGKDDKLAPVTTDAVASTPIPPTGKIDLDAPTPPLPKMAGGELMDDEPGFVADRSVPVRGPMVTLFGGAADELSVADLFDRIRDFKDAIKARHWGAAYATGGAIILVFSDLMQRGAFSLFGTTAADARALSTADSLGLELASARNDLSAATASGRGLLWEGGEPSPLSGSPAAMGQPRGAELATIDPASLLIIYEIVAKIWEAIQRRRQNR